MIPDAFKTLHMDRIDVLNFDTKINLDEFYF